MSASAFPGSRDDWYRAGMIATTETELELTVGPGVERRGTGNLTTRVRTLLRRGERTAVSLPHDRGSTGGAAPRHGGVHRVAGLGRRRHSPGATSPHHPTVDRSRAVRRTRERHAGAGRPFTRAAGR